MKIGILTAGHTPDTLPQWSGYGEMFRTLLKDQGFDFAEYMVVDGEFPEDVTEADGWLITGSRHGAYEDHPWIAPLEDFIRASFEADVPMVGICFGHQVMAQALGGKVENFAGGWSVGRRDYHFGDETVALNAWHQDQVVEKPEGAEVVASNDFCANAALLYGRKGFSVQPHPEFTAEFLDGLIETRGAAVPDNLLAEARRNLAVPTDQARLAEMIGQFFRQRSVA